LEELPPANTRRRRKAAVVAAVQGGKIPLGEARRRYQLTEEEFRAWRRAYDTDGLPGLRAAARPQQYRTPVSPRRQRPRCRLPLGLIYYAVWPICFPLRWI